MLDPCRDCQLAGRRISRVAGKEPTLGSKDLGLCETETTHNLHYAADPYNVDPVDNKQC